jgi:hypothetical protein
MKCYEIQRLKENNNGTRINRLPTLQLGKDQVIEGSLTHVFTKELLPFLE